MDEDLQLLVQVAGIYFLKETSKRGKLQGVNNG